jgi:ech hydrogenase subunit E
MKKNITIPLGSQHISLLEPVKFRFECENEKIVEVNSDVGFVHRGIEKACASQFTYDALPYVVARVCGLCAITHSLTYTQAIEEILQIEVTPRINYLRLLLLELDRIHSHMLCLAHVCENVGYKALFMQIMSYREPIMSLQEELTGNRVQFDYISIGGVNRDIEAKTAHHVNEVLQKLKHDIFELIEEFDSNWTLSLRYKNIGVLTKQQAYSYNTIGPLARASGLAHDVRNETNSLPFKEVGYKLILKSNGDVYSRNMVRLEEIINSIEMCCNIVHNIPTGEIQVKAKGKPQGEALVRLEAPRGELMYYVKGNGKNILQRVRIKTPTFSSIPAFMEVFKGQEYANAPAILASFDPCMSCTAK